MIAFLITAAIIGIMLLIVVKKHCFATAWATGIRSLPLAAWLMGRGIGGKLMPAFSATIFLESRFIFAITVE
ncbi:hypothetical protein ALO_17830 [Acetonema longum DSM 6540]|uniref:Uncharacterized protein n=1 Tax=Acetonema longum DSM 6540 TaxID=1009370 RepID=F7NN81_9FIRM|nr:hypothetical protein ALO_17830 [Acetonema longum DSM 6540]